MRNNLENIANALWRECVVIKGSLSSCLCPIMRMFVIFLQMLSFRQLLYAILRIAIVITRIMLMHILRNLFCWQLEKEVDRTSDLQSTQQDLLQGLQLDCTTKYLFQFFIIFFLFLGKKPLNVWFWYSLINYPWQSEDKLDNADTYKHLLLFLGA